MNIPELEYTLDFIFRDERDPKFIQFRSLVPAVKSHSLKYPLSRYPAPAGESRQICFPRFCQVVTGHVGSVRKSNLTASMVVLLCVLL
jgi:hypothetical protein